MEIETLQGFKVGLKQRVLPETFVQKIDHCQSKLPLSRVIALEIARQQMIDPAKRPCPMQISVLTLSEGERARLMQGSAPWTRGSEAEKALFQETLARLKGHIDAKLKMGEKGEDLSSP